MKENNKASFPAVHPNDLLENIFFKMSPDLFCIVSKEGFFEALNPAWETTLGYSIDEILHTKLTDLLHPEDLNRTLAQSEIQASGIETKDFQNRYRCKDGSYKWLEWRATTNQSDFSRFAVARDITERKKAENENLKTQKLLEDSQRIGKIGGWEVNIDTMELKWTKEMYNINEVDPTFKPTLDQRVNFYTAESLADVDNAVRKAIAQNGSYEIDSEIITGKGNRRSVKTMGKADLESRRVYGLFQDITERKLIEQALKESEEKFRSIFQNHSSVKLLIDPENATIVDANNAAAEYYGWTVNELTGMKISRINTCESSEVENKIQLVVNKQKTTFEAEHRRADGSIRNVNVNSGIIKINGKEYLHSIISDITDRKRAEEIIKSQAELLDLAHDGIIVRDMDSKITYWNKGAAARYGYTSDEAIGKVLHDLLRAVFPVSMEEILNELLEKEYWEGELNHTTKNGSVLIVASRWHLQKDRNKQPIAIFEINIDITAQKKAELDIKLKNEELNKTNAEKDKFFSILAHDLRSPFNGFLGLTEMMVSDLRNMTLDEIQNISLLMQRSAANLYDLLGNLLEWSRIQRGIIEVIPESFLLLPGILEDLKSIEESIKNKNIQLNISIKDDLRVYTDPNMLNVIIRNLINNSVKFTHIGGRINISAKSISNNATEITVKDSGIGMSKQMVETLFKLDHKNGRKGTEGESSSGMGLIICKDLIEKLGGELHVQSTEGKGTEFRFTLPMPEPKLIEQALKNSFS